MFKNGTENEENNEGNKAEEQEHMQPSEAEENLRLWKRLMPTDPKQTRPFQRPGGFKGTAIKPLWNVMRLTETFGPMGTGWGTEQPEFRVVDAGDETLVFCILKCWYNETDQFGDKRAYLWGIGGDRVASKRAGAMFADDESFKKAYTDALGNAFMRLGVSADVYLGLFEDSKYLMSVREHYDNTRAIQAQLEGGKNDK
jgi:hypothetical protein